MILAKTVCESDGNKKTCHALKKHTIYPEGSSYFLGVLFRASVQETYSNKAGTQPNYTSG